ncbi:MAG: restriction endonuclease [Acetobacteraceae bacterium]|nr:restriction endonuclease [Acetobacteraceae bacterium]
MAIPDFQSFLKPVLALVAERRWQARELIGRLADDLGLTADERAQLLPSGRQSVLANRVHWAVTYLVQAGLIRRPARGECEITEAGRALLAEAPQALSVAELARRYPSLQAFRERRRDNAAAPEKPAQPGSPAAEANGASTPDDLIERAVADIEQKVRAELRERLLEQPPEFFERVVIDLLLAMGYGSSAEEAAEQLGRTGDGGVDGVIREDRLGLDVLYIQAKRYRDQPVTVDQVRSFAGALQDKGARKGVLITASRFTDDAIAFAARQQQLRIVLVDGNELTRLMLRHDIGVRPARTIVLKKLDLDYFEPEEGA